MRTNIKIVGIGTRRTGTGKNTGKAYDFVPVSFVYKEEGVHGFSAVTSNIPGKMYDEIGGLELNKEYDTVMHSWNFSMVIDAILK